MRQASAPFAALLGAALLAAGCASGPASAPTAAAGPAAATPKPATPATISANQAMRPVVAAFDKRDFEDAARGKLAELSDPLVRSADGRIVWDTRKFDFLKADPSATVNPACGATSSCNMRRACSRWPTAFTRSAATTSPT